MRGVTAVLTFFLLRGITAVTGEAVTTATADTESSSPATMEDYPVATKQGEDRQDNVLTIDDLIGKGTFKTLFDWTVGSFEGIVRNFLTISLKGFLGADIDKNNNPLQTTSLAKSLQDGMTFLAGNWYGSYVFSLPTFFIFLLMFATTMPQLFEIWYDIERMVTTPVPKPIFTPSSSPMFVRPDDRSFTLRNPKTQTETSLGAFQSSQISHDDDSTAVNPLLASVLKPGTAVSLDSPGNQQARVVSHHPHDGSFYGADDRMKEKSMSSIDNPVTKKASTTNVGRGRSDQKTPSMEKRV